ncbi:MAG: cation-binding protein [Burkholderiales bacterium]|nr:cation-binding protein [Burkholderiales bacterium]
MHALMRKLGPRATDMIRADHTRVIAAFHRYKADSAPGRKKAIVGMVCTSLQVHAQIEEEIFYPAMRAAGSTLIADLEPEHAEMRSAIATLSGMEPTDPQYDQAFMELMRTVIHHAADEETLLLSHADTVLGDRLGELGAQMMKRRAELMAPRAGAMAGQKARAMPGGALAVAGALLAAGLYFMRRRA